VGRAQAILTQVKSVGTAESDTGKQNISTYSCTILRDHPVTYYPLDERTSSIAFDLSGNNHIGIVENGLPTNAPGLPYDPRRRKMGFTGNNSYATVNSTTPNLLDYRADFTVEAWARRTNPKRMEPYQAEAIVCKDIDRHGGHYGLMCYSSDDRNCCYLFQIGFTGEDPKGLFSTMQLPGPQIRMEMNRWYHIVGVYTQATARMLLYVDGHLVAQKSTTGTKLPQNSGPLGIAYMPGYTYFWNGQICEVAIYDHALSGEQIHRHYELGIHAKP